MGNVLAIGAGMALAVLALVGCQGVSKATQVQADIEKGIGQLAEIEREFVRDGASDYGVEVQDDPDVWRLGTREAVPTLISHIADQRLTKVVYREVEPGTGKPRSTAVPLGYLCLDILLQLSLRDSPPIVESGDDGGWRAHTDERFYFAPDALTRPDGPLVMKQVRQAWREAFEGGQLKFRESPLGWEKM